MGKCRVAPLLGMTVPRGEMQALTIMTRLLVVAAEAFPARFVSISSYTDSMCSLGALSRTSSALKPYFGNRVSEIQHLRTQLSDLTDDLAPVHHVPGTLNPADVGTRSGVLVDELTGGPHGSGGPPFLSRPYEDWPITTDEARYTARVLWRRFALVTGRTLRPVQRSRHSRDRAGMWLVSCSAASAREEAWVPAFEPSL